MSKRKQNPNPNLNPLDNLSGKQVIKALVDWLRRERQGSERWPERKAVIDILTALRGPDDEDDSVKDVTTARLRALIGLPEGRGMVVNHDGKPVDLGKSIESGSHFAWHMEMAVTALRTLGFTSRRQTLRRDEVPF